MHDLDLTFARVKEGIITPWLRSEVVNITFTLPLCAIDTFLYILSIVCRFPGILEARIVVYCRHDVLSRSSPQTCMYMLYNVYIL